MMESRRLLKELYIGIAIHVAIFMLLGIIFMRPLWLYEVSLLAGGSVSALLLYHTYDCLDRALELPAKNAKSFITIRVIFRLVVRVGLMIIGVLIHWTALVGVLVGMLSPKTSAYLNPIKDSRTNMLTGVQTVLLL